MNPNSTHQMWSRWTATVTTDPALVPPSFEQVKENCARFYRKAFGSATELNITGSDVPGGTWIIDCRTEGHPAHDPTYVAYMTSELRRFLVVGFAHAQVAFDVKLEAGSRQDGTPADQLIFGPPPIVLAAALLGDREHSDG